MKRYTLAILLIALLCAGCDGSDEQDETPPVLTVELTPLFDIGRDTGDESLPLLSGIGGVVTDTAGRIYVTDPRASVMHVYSPKGAYLETIGGKGEAPGEFTDMRILHAFSDGRIMVYDYMQARLSFQDPSTGELSIEPISRNSFGATADVDGRLIMQHVSHTEPDILDKPAFEIYVDDFMAPVGTFGTYSQISSDTSQIGKAIMSDGNALTLDHGRLLFAPNGYAGRLLLYKKSGSDWSFSGYVEGRSVERAYEEIENPTRENAQMLLYGRGPVRGAKLYSTSSHLARLSDGRVLHFSLRFEDFDMHPHVELFDADLDLVAHGDLFPARDDAGHEGRPDEPPTAMYPAWVDAEDRLYAIQYSPEPLVRVFEMDLSSE